MIGKTGASSTTESDKYFWHRYTDTYLAAFSRLGPVRRIVEFGVFHGASIRWLSGLFPEAQITGLDLLPVQDDWPQADHIRYRQVDQGDRFAVRAVLAEFDAIDLLIEDGSHMPRHQSRFLIEGLPRIRSGGLYILEDIHTNHPLNEAFRTYNVSSGRRMPNPLLVLMALQHCKDTGLDWSGPRLSTLADPEFMSEDDLRTLMLLTARVELYKRTQLPLKCFSCGCSEFDYLQWSCSCGAALNDPGDSMTALIWKK